MNILLSFIVFIFFNSLTYPLIVSIDFSIYSSIVLALILTIVCYPLYKIDKI